MWDEDRRCHTNVQSGEPGERDTSGVLRVLVLTGLLLVFVGSGASGLPRGDAATKDPPPLGFRLASVPTYQLSVPPGGREGGKAISAHWFAVPGSTFLAGTDEWIMGSFYFPGDMPVARNWAVVWNFHTQAGDIGWPVGVSPVLLQILDGFVQVWTNGAGTLGTVGGVQQPVSTTKRTFPKPCRLPILRDRWSDWVMHVKFDSRHGYVKLWQNGTLIVNANNIPTLYTNERTIQLWVGFYTDGAANPDKTFSMQLTLPRIGATYQAAAGNTPGKPDQWGSLELDPSVVQTIAPRPPSAFVYPRSLDGRATCGR